MYERMLDKSNKPCLSQIIEYIGKDGYARLCKLETYLKTQYNLSRELRFPFGNNYGWGYKYSHKSFHLFYAFFERCSNNYTGNEILAYVYDPFGNMGGVDLV